PALAVGRVLLSTLAEGVVELLEQLALVLGELNGGFRLDVTVEVARVARAHALDALATQAEGLAVLRAFGDGDFRLAPQGGHLDSAAQGRRGQRNGDGAVQVVAIALEDLVFLDADLDVEVARGTPIGARLAVARRAD